MKYDFRRKIKSRKQIPVTAESLNSMFARRITLLIIATMIFMAADYMAGDLGSVKVFKDNGSMYMQRPEGHSSSITLHARVAGSDETFEKNYDISLDPKSSENVNADDGKATSEYAEKSSDEEMLSYRMRSLVSEFNNDTSSGKVLLPSRLDTGEQITWTVEHRRNTAVIAAASLAICILLFRERMAPLRKQRKQNLESITRHLPEFVNKLVLLLNAGLVLNSAFEKSIEESLKFRRDTDDYFYTKMKEIYVTLYQTNGSFGILFRDFAKSAGTNELMRISNILTDNISKGVELTDKLQLESETLWINRKRDCEERGRIAETKLTLPLTLFLGVLIVITVSPALLEI